MGTHYRGTAEEVRALEAYIKLMRSAASVQRRLDGHLRAMGLTESQLGVVEMLHHLGPLHQHEIGRKLLLSPANVTLLVDQLGERGLVRRECDPADRRKNRVHLTAEGRRRITRLFPRHVRCIVEAFAPLAPEEQAQLARLCRKIGLANQIARD